MSPSALSARPSPGSPPVTRSFASMCGGSAHARSSSACGTAPKPTRTGMTYRWHPPCTPRSAISAGSCPDSLLATSTSVITAGLPANQHTMTSGNACRQRQNQVSLDQVRRGGRARSVVDVVDGGGRRRRPGVGIGSVALSSRRARYRSVSIPGRRGGVEGVSVGHRSVPSSAAADHRTGVGGGRTGGAWNGCAGVEGPGGVRRPPCYVNR